MNREHKNAFCLHTGAILLILLSLLSATAARAEDQNGGWPGDWLTSYKSARAMGLGGSFTSLADEPLGMIWNPAGMTQLSRNEVFLETSRYFEGTSINTISFAVPGTKFPSLGLAILSLSSDDFQKTNHLNEDIGTFREGETAYVLSASHNVHNQISVGANLRLVHQSIDEFSATGVGFDLGILARPVPTVRVGLSVANLGGPSLELRENIETYPTQLRGGVTVDLLDGQGLITAEIEKISDLRTNVRGGCEYWIKRLIALRVGFDGSDPSGGFTVNLPSDLRLDYGVGDHDLGLIHRISISWRFGGFFAKSQASSAVISPLGTKAATRFDLAANTRYELESWRLEITDKNGEIVRKFGGRGTPPSHLMWDGKTATGKPLPDGSYQYRLVVQDQGGLEIIGDDQPIGIDTKVRDIRVPVQISGR